MRKYGYSVNDRLYTMRMMFEEREDAPYTVELISFSEWKELAVSEEPVPWQNKIPFVDHREIYAIKDDGETRGYLVLSQQPNKILTLFQLQAVDVGAAYDLLLSSVEHHFLGYRIVAFNVPHQHPVYETYQSREPQQVIEQVWMKN